MVWTIGRKIGLSFSVFIVLLLFVAVVSRVQNQSAIDELQVLKEEEREARLMWDLTDLLQRVERSVLSQLLLDGSSGDDPKVLLAEAQEKLAMLQRDATGRDEEEEGHEKREEDLLAQIDRGVGRVRSLLPLGSIRDLPEAERRRTAQRLLVEYEATAKAINEFHREDYDVTHVAIKSGKRAVQSSANIAFYTSIACVLVAIVAGWYFVKKLTGPIKVLREGARRIGEGNFDYQFTVGTSDEIGELAQEFKKMSLRLKDSYADLEKQVSERTRQLLHSARLAGIGTLAAGIAHEINNPLASVASCAEGLLARTNEATFKGVGAVDDFREYLEIIRDETYRCNAITRNLLDFSRKQDPVVQRVDLTERIQGVMALLKRRAETEGKTLFLTESVHDAAVDADPSQLSQLFFNVICNALDAVGSGGTVSIRIEAEETGPVRVCVEDNGSGIATDALERIWEPFYTTKSPGKGTGLGLSLCYSIIRSHNGTIACSSAGPGQGTTFLITLQRQWRLEAS